nr:protein PXR1-like isoform X3 [Hydra vulgaris]
MACNIKLKKILWARVVWQENENSFFEDVLPANWINEEMGVVFWPSTMSVQRAISENIEVDHESWRKFKWLKTKIVDEDRQLCNDFNFTSCGEQVTTDDEFSNQVTSGISKDVPILLPKPPSSYKLSIDILKENKNKTVKDLTLHSDATSDDDEIVDFIRLNKKRNINSQSPSHHAGAKPNKKSKKEKQQFPMEEESQSQSTSHHAVTKRKKKSKKEKQQFPLEEESQSQSPSHCTVTKCDKKSKKEKQPFPMEKGKYQRKSLRYLVEIRDLLSKLVEVKDPENSKFHIEKINNSDQLDELEEVIKDDVQRKAILSKLKNIGGVDMAECTRNMLGKLFSVNLMANMNIKGSKRKGRENKISFENLKLKDVMFEALQDRYTVSEKELFRVVGNKLKNAPGRLNHSIDI